MLLEGLLEPVVLAVAVRIVQERLLLPLREVLAVSAETRTQTPQAALAVRFKLTEPQEQMEPVAVAVVVLVLLVQLLAQALPVVPALSTR